MSESDYLYASHNVSKLVYHFVCPAKYRRVIFTEAVDKTLVQICAAYQHGMTRSDSWK